VPDLQRIGLGLVLGLEGETMRGIFCMVAGGILAAVSLGPAAALADEPGGAAGGAGGAGQASSGAAGASSGPRIDVRGMMPSFDSAGVPTFGNGGPFDPLGGAPTFQGGGFFGTGSGSIGGFDSLGSGGELSIP